MYIFVADIHLRPGRKEDAQRFVSWLARTEKTASHIYILGDLFDYYYTGLEPRVQDVLTALQSPRIHVLTGNRDFLLNNMDVNTIDVIHNDELVIDLYGNEVLIAHGHTLTDTDRGFKLLHRYGWPLLTLADKVLPSCIKDRCARFLVKSSAAIRPPHTRIRDDIAPSRDVMTVICGHLHKASMGSRLIVLPAFFDTGRWLIWDTEGPRFSGPDPQTRE